MFKFSLAETEQCALDPGQRPGVRMCHLSTGTSYISF